MNLGCSGKGWNTPDACNNLAKAFLHEDHKQPRHALSLSMDLELSPGTCRIPIPPLAFQDSIVECLSSTNKLGIPSVIAQFCLCFAGAMMIEAGPGRSRDSIQRLLPSPAVGPESLRPGTGADRTWTGNPSLLRNGQSSPTPSSSADKLSKNFPGDDEIAVSISWRASFVLRS